LVEVRLPDGASRERTREAVARATGIVRDLPGKPDVVAFGEGEPNAATLLVKLPKDGPAIADIRKALVSLREMVCRVTDVSAGAKPFPARIALCGEGHDDLRRWADAVTKRVNEADASADADAWPRGDRTWTTTNIDRKKAELMGVTVQDITDTISTFGSARMGPDDLKRLQVRNRDGERVPLGTIVEFRTVTGPDAVYLVGSEYALRLTANPAADETPSAAATRFVKVAGEERARLKLPAAFRVTDLTRPGKPR
jgi:multidrug efflux pump